MSQGTAVRPEASISQTDGPVLLCELEPWHRAFLRNLRDLFSAEPPPLELTAEPIPVGPDTFIRTGIAPRRFLESGGYHIALVVVVYLVCTLPFFNRTVKLKSPFEDTKISYQPLSDYLPPINTGHKSEPKPRKGEPKLAKQEILSVPPQPDNAHQTIITPPKIKLPQDVALPNIVAWTPVPAQQPIAASARSVNKLTLPQFDVPVVEPTADVSKLRAKLQTPVLPQPTVVEPAVDLSRVKPKLQTPTLPQASVLEPPLSPDQLKLKAGQINMAEMQPTVAAPKLPVPAQSASGSAESGQAAKATAQAVPAQPNVANLPGSSKGQGQIIALGLNPDVRAPVTVPNGNRSGEFHASPGGKPDAPGTPTVTGSGTSKEPAGSGKDSGAPPGIFVAAPPAGANPSAVAGTPGPGKPAPTDAEMEARKRIIAAAMGPNLPNIHHNAPPPPPASDVSSVEQRVFGNKPFYSVILNMPNLTSATGSWIVRYAELKQSRDKITLTAPVATTKVDPAYPPDVLRDRVEGTVTLYAVIHSDGSVGEIRVLDSLDSRLDDNAVRALSRWRFRPGTKNGEPVDIEAVVQIPFRMRHLQ